MDECKEGVEDDSQDSGVEHWIDDGSVYQHKRNNEGSWGERPRPWLGEFSTGHACAYLIHQNPLKRWI